MRKNIFIGLFAFIAISSWAYTEDNTSINVNNDNNLEKLGEFINIGVQWNSAYQYPKEGMNTAYYFIDSSVESVKVEIPKCGSSFYSVVSFSKILPNFDYPSYISPENVTIGVQGNGGALSVNLTEFGPSYPYLMVSYYSAEGEPTVKASFKEDTGGDKQSLNILFFGNSFTQDAVSYAPFILKELYPDCNLNIGMCLIGGCKMVQHCANITNQNQTLLDDIYEPANYAYFEYANNSTQWSNQISMSAEEVLHHKDWDVVTFQQNGYDNFRDYAIYYEPYINTTFDALTAQLSKPVKIGWLLTHGSYTTDKSVAYERWVGSMANSKRVINESCAEILFPYGTAIENLRTTGITTSYGECLLADDAHLQEGISTLTASYSVVLTLLELMEVENACIFGDNTRPTLEWLQYRNISGMNFAIPNMVEGITEENCHLAQMCATEANRNPYAVISEGLDIRTPTSFGENKKPVFDLHGRRYNTLQKGINVVNGQKIIIMK